MPYWRLPDHPKRTPDRAEATFESDRLLDRVILADLNGRRAEEALYLAGCVKFYREDYKEADRYFSQLVDMHPNSRFAPQAVELAIISKHMSTGGSDYDGRKVAESAQARGHGASQLPDVGCSEERVPARASSRASTCSRRKRTSRSRSSTGGPGIRGQHTFTTTSYAVDIPELAFSTMPPCACRSCVNIRGKIRTRLPPLDLLRNHLARPRHPARPRHRERRP